MLGFFRRIINSKVGIVVVFVVLGVIALAFAAGDVTGLRQGGGGMLGSSVATVDGKGIGAADLKARAQNELRSVQQRSPTVDMAQFIAGGGFDATLERMINALALQSFGDDHGMAVSKRAVDGQLASIPALQNPATGKFDQKIYEQVLAQQRLNDGAIRGDIARDTMAQYLIVPTLGASQVPQALAAPYAALLLEKRAGQIGFIPTRAMGAGAPPTDAELQTFYQRNIARYTTPERRVIRYARVTPDSVKAQATPSAAEIAQAYRAAGAKYAATEKRTITQVTVLDRNAATALAAKVKGGQSLADAARAAGLEPQTVTSVDKAAFAAQSSPAVADAAFAAAKGAVVGPVPGAIGFVVARVDAAEQVAARSLADATPEITAALTTQKTTAALGRIHDALDDAIADKGNFNELVGDQKLAATTTPALLANGINPDTPDAKPDPALVPMLTAAFQAEEGDDPQLVQTAPDGSFALVALDRIVRAAPRPLAQVRDAVVRDFSIDRARRAARQVANAVTAKVNKGMPLQQALAQTGLQLPPLQPLDASRAQLAQNPQGAPAPLVLLFSMASNTAKMLEAPQQGGWFVIHLDRIVPGDARTQPGIVNATRADLGRVIGREYVQQFTVAVKRDVGVSTNAGAVAKAKADLTGQGGSDQQ